MGFTISVGSGWTQPNVDPIRVGPDPTLTTKCSDFFRVEFKFFFYQVELGRVRLGLCQARPDSTFCHSSFIIKNPFGSYNISVNRSRY